MVMVTFPSLMVFLLCSWHKKRHNFDLHIKMCKKISWDKYLPNTRIIVTHFFRDYFYGSLKTKLFVRIKLPLKEYRRVANLKEDKSCIGTPPHPVTCKLKVFFSLQVVCGYWISVYKNSLFESGTKLSFYYIKSF